MSADDTSLPRRHARCETSLKGDLRVRSERCDSSRVSRLDGQRALDAVLREILHGMQQQPGLLDRLASRFPNATLVEKLDALHAAGCRLVLRHVASRLINAQHPLGRSSRADDPRRASDLHTQGLFTPGDAAGLSLDRFALAEVERCLALNEPLVDDLLEMSAGTDVAPSGAIPMSADLLGKLYGQFLDCRFRLQSSSADQEPLPLAERIQLETSRHSRKCSGTFYTPMALAEATARHTLLPLCYDVSFEVSTRGARGEEPNLRPLRPEEILKLKICDPACGAAVFLVAALHFLSKALMESYRFYEPNRVPDERECRQRVAERMLYGVDLDPIAIDLARVTLWLEVGDPTVPLTFLDQHLRTGNALVGGRIQHACSNNVEVETCESPDAERDKQWAACDRWCIQQLTLNSAETPRHSDRRETEADVAAKGAMAPKFFHWELAFPEVFGPSRCGFDAVLGNPPWETIQPESQEFFSRFDAEYPQLNKQAALERQRQLCVRDPDVAESWRTYQAHYSALACWLKRTPQAVSTQQESFRPSLSDTLKSQGNGKTYSYKVFIEIAFTLLAQGGRLGLIVPSGLYTDSGCQALRELLLKQAHWEWLCGFENLKRVFDIDGRFKFAAIVVEKSNRRGPLNTSFFNHELAAWGQPAPASVQLTVNDIQEFSPQTWSIVETTRPRDGEVCRRILDHSFLIGDAPSDWAFSYTQEFNMTSDSGHFESRLAAEARGFQAEELGHWTDGSGKILLPLYEGRMVGQCDFSQRGYVSGRGRSAKWIELPFNDKHLAPQFVVEAATFKNWKRRLPGTRLGFMSTGSATNTRTAIASVLPQFPCGNSLSVLTIDGGNLAKALYLAAVFSSFPYDFALRMRMGGTNLNWYLLQETPIPQAPDDWRFDRLVVNTARLTMVHCCFAREWRQLLSTYPRLRTRPWQSWWAIEDITRRRLRLENECLIAELYGLGPDDIDWIVRDDPTDRKGFWRVEKVLPFSQRLTGQTAEAVRRGWQAGHDLFVKTDLPPDNENWHVPDQAKRSPIECAKQRTDRPSQEDAPVDSQIDPQYIWMDWTQCLADADVLDAAMGASDTLRAPSAAATRAPLFAWASR